MEQGFDNCVPSGLRTANRGSGCVRNRWCRAGRTGSREVISRESICCDELDRELENQSGEISPAGSSLVVPAILSLKSEDASIGGGLRFASGKQGETKGSCA
jgi:hypothetical protein